MMTSSKNLYMEISAEEKRNDKKGQLKPLAEMISKYSKQILVP